MHNLDFHTIETPTIFYFIRHGESKGNSQGRIQGRQDLPLSNLGRRQAESAGEYFAKLDGFALSAIYSSPLSRAWETAEILARQIASSQASDPPSPQMLPTQPPPIQRLDDLVEIDTGIFTGLTFDEAKTRFPEDWESFQELSWEGVQSAERIASLVQRATRVWETLIAHAKADHRHVLTVSHGGMLNWIIKRSLAERWSAWLPVFRTGNCCIHAMEIYPHRSNRSSNKNRKPLGYIEWKLVNYKPY